MPDGRHAVDGEVVAGSHLRFGRRDQRRQGGQFRSPLRLPRRHARAGAPPGEGDEYRSDGSVKGHRRWAARPGAEVESAAAGAGGSPSPSRNTLQHARRACARHDHEQQQRTDPHAIRQRRRLRQQEQPRCRTETEQERPAPAAASPAHGGPDDDQRQQRPLRPGGNPQVPARPQSYRVPEHPERLVDRQRPSLACSRQHTPEVVEPLGRENGRVQRRGQAEGRHRPRRHAKGEAPEFPAAIPAPSGEDHPKRRRSRRIPHDGHGEEAQCDRRRPSRPGRSVAGRPHQCSPKQQRAHEQKQHERVAPRVGGVLAEVGRRGYESGRQRGRLPPVLFSREPPHCGKQQAAGRKRRNAQHDTAPPAQLMRNPNQQRVQHMVVGRLVLACGCCKRLRRILDNRHALVGSERGVQVVRGQADASCNDDHCQHGLGDIGVRNGA